MITQNWWSPSKSTPNPKGHSSLDSPILGTINPRGSLTSLFLGSHPSSKCQSLSKLKSHVLFHPRAHLPQKTYSTFWNIISSKYPMRDNAKIWLIRIQSSKSFLQAQLSRMESLHILAMQNYYCDTEVPSTQCKSLSGSNTYLSLFLSLM